MEVDLVINSWGRTYRGYTFEARLDAYLRHHDLLRATHRGPVGTQGAE
jgi:hypothetical protein